MGLDKSSKSLRELMAARGKGSTSKEDPKSKVPSKLPPPPPQVPSDLRLKPMAELAKKRPVEVLKEGEVGLRKGTKQQKVAKNHQDKRSTSIDSREDSLGRGAPTTAHLVPLVGGGWCPYSLGLFSPSFLGGARRSLLLPRDMDDYKHFKQPDLFLSLKRDLAIVSG